MSKFEFKLPDIGEGVTEGEIVNWLVKEGDTVAEDQEMVEVMTDKATVTIGAPKSGRVVELRGKVGDVIPVGQVLVVFDLSSAGASPQHAASEAPAQRAAAPKETAASAVGDIKEELPGMAVARRAPPKPAGGNGKPSYFNEKPLAAPATRKLAREIGVDLRQVEPSGPGGRVVREDIERYRELGVRIERVESPSSLHDGVTLRPAPKAPPPRPMATRASEQRVPIQGLRRRIFENMARSKHTAAHFTYVDECNAGNLRELRRRCNAATEQQGVKLSFLPFIIKAVVAALKLHPALNCLVDDARQEMVLRHDYDIGIASATEAGLIVPVVRGADQLSIIELAGEIERLGAAARAGKVKAEDLGGSSFTITSLGKLGGLFATPIINYPEVAILGVHEMKRRPVVEGDRIVVGEVMLLSLSFDHRVIDGHVGAAFAREIVGILEEPERLLLSMR
jgi:pyruvate/2-oxoglutarate dehydrogenase complex dihydrolipoamide acyltransferase (E2) component